MADGADLGVRKNPLKILDIGLHFARLTRDDELDGADAAGKIGQPLRGAQSNGNLVVFRSAGLVEACDVAGLAAICISQGKICALLDVPLTRDICAYNTLVARGWRSHIGNEREVRQRANRRYEKR